MKNVTVAMISSTGMVSKTRRAINLTMGREFDGLFACSAAPHPRPTWRIYPEDSLVPGSSWHGQGPRLGPGRDFLGRLQINIFVGVMVEQGRIPALHTRLKQIRMSVVVNGNQGQFFQQDGLGLFK